MSEIIWLPHKAHFIGSSDCMFGLATYVNGVIVSTVGDYMPRLGPETEGIVPKRVRTKIGLSRFYETMVFKTKKNPDPSCGCPYIPSDWHNIDFCGYNTGAAAVDGHLEMVEKYKHRVPSEAME